MTPKVRVVRFLLFVFAIIALSLRVGAQPKAMWEDSYGPADFNYIFALSAAPNNGLLSAGSAIDKEGGNNYWFTRLDSNGAVIWEKSLGPGEENSLFNSIATREHGFVLGGMVDVDSIFDGYHENDSLPIDGALVAIDDSGNIRWTHCYGGTRDDELVSVVSTYDGGYVFTGTTNSIDGDIQDYHGDPDSNSAQLWVEKVDSTGNVLWERTLGGSGLDLGVGIAELTDRSIGVIANTNSTDGDVTSPLGGYDIWVVHLDSTGNLLWQKTFGTSGSDGATGIIASNSGTMLVAGYMSYQSSSGATSAMWAAKLAPDGSTIWQTDLADWAGYSLMSMTQIPSGVPRTTGRLLLAARALDQSGDLQNWMLAFDSNGHLVSRTPFSNGSLNGMSFEIPSVDAITCDSSGGFAIASSLSSDTNVVGLIAKFFPASLGVKTTIRTNGNPLEVYPVPASSVIHIQLDAIQLDAPNGPATIRIFNTLGNCVLTDTRHSNSNSDVPLDVSSLPRGIYYLEVESNGLTAGRMIVLE